MFPAAVHSANSTSATSRGSQKAASRGGRSPAVNGDRVTRERAEQPLQAVQLGVAEARADAPHEAQPAVRLTDAEQKRADRLPSPALAREPAADDELLARRMVLIFSQLPPRRRRAVRRVEALRDDPLQLLLPARRQQLRAVPGERAPASASSRRCSASSPSLARRSA